MASKDTPTRPKADANTPRPDWIRCSGAVFDIEWYDSLDELKSKVDDENIRVNPTIHAVTDTWNRIIRMGTWPALDVQRENLLHEVMHACMSVVRGEMDALPEAMAKFPEDTDWEEWYITALDGPLTHTLRDNPLATKWMLGGA